MSGNTNDNRREIEFVSAKDTSKMQKTASNKTDLVSEIDTIIKYLISISR